MLGARVFLGVTEGLLISEISIYVLSKRYKATTTKWTSLIEVAAVASLFYVYRKLHR